MSASGQGTFGGGDLQCAEVQNSLSLYLYGELDFAAEEALERHLADCPLCQFALVREKRWHTNLNSVAQEIPADLLASCRESLRDAIAQDAATPTFAPEPLRERMKRWLGIAGFRATQWSGRLALASFFIFIGMMISRFASDVTMFSPQSSALQMGLVGSPESRVRDIQSVGEGKIRITVDRLEERELVGSLDDSVIRQMLMAAARNSADPGLRIDSVEMLRHQEGDDIRDALISTVRHDQNSAVRLKAIDALQTFAGDVPTREALVYVLEHDADPGIRARAIDVLLPPNGRVAVGPDLIRALQGISRTDAENDYVRVRCLQILSAVGAVDVERRPIY